MANNIFLVNTPEYKNLVYSNKQALYDKHFKALEQSKQLPNVKLSSDKPVKFTYRNFCAYHKALKSENKLVSLTVNDITIEEQRVINKA